MSPIFEHRAEPLIPRGEFIIRMVFHTLAALGIVVASLGLGILGYHVLEGMPWVDATVNAAMILGGMGPVGELHTNAGKLFAAAYALFSGLAFIVFAGVLFAPIFHRFLHRFHLDLAEEDATARGPA